LWCWILFFFAWCTVVALGVTTCALMIIFNTIFILFFAIFKEFFPHFLDYVLFHVFCCVIMSTMFFFSQLAHYFCIGVVTFTLVIITNNACCWLLNNF
jgi:hypothetical protein